jgi:hypothetical protein
MSENKTLLLKTIDEVVGAEVTKTVDHEIISYCSAIIDFHDFVNDDLFVAVGPMLSDFIGEDETKQVAASITSEKQGEKKKKKKKKKKKEKKKAT